MPHSYLPSTTQLNAVIYFNHEVFDSQNFEDPVKTTSKLTSQTLNFHRSSFEFKLQRTFIKDEHTYFQLGEVNEYEFYNAMQTDANNFNVSPLIKSHYPDDVYFSTFVTLSSDLHTFERKNPSFVNLIAEVGGLLSALYVIGNIIMGYYSSWAATALLSRFMVRFQSFGEE